MSVVSQFLSTPRTTHWDDVVQFFGYLKKAPNKELLYQIMDTLKLVSQMLIGQVPH